MNKTLTVANNKGGVGKTTNVQGIAAYCSHHEIRVLLLDMDPQCNLTSDMLKVNYGEDGDEYLPFHPNHDGKRFDISNIFLEQELDPYPTRLKHVDIIPSKPSCIQLDGQDASLAEVFFDFIHQEAISTLYDVIIIDTPPAKGLLTAAALRASTDILIPVVLERKSVEGLLGMISKIETENDAKSLDEQSRILGILPNKFDSRIKVHKDFLEKLNDHEELGAIAPLMIPGEILNQPNLQSFVIKERPSLKEMDLNGATPSTPFQMRKSSDIRKEWEALGNYITKEMGVC